MSLAVSGSKSVLGKTLSSLDIENGLREMNQDLHFDMPNKLEHANFVFQSDNFEVINSNRQGIYWHGHYITGMDRGIVTEHKLWEEEEGVEEIPASPTADSVYVEILPTDTFYNEALLKAQKHDDNFTQDPDGKVFKWTFFRVTKVKGRIIRLGWRHTLENLIGSKIPGVTQRAVEQRFGVDMSLKPFGPDAGAAFTEE